MLLKKVVYLPNIFTVNMRVFLFRLLESWKHAYKSLCINKIEQGNLENHVAFLKNSLSQFIEMLRLSCLDVFLEVTPNEIV